MSCHIREEGETVSPTPALLLDAVILENRVIRHTQQNERAHVTLNSNTTLDDTQYHKTTK